MVLKNKLHQALDTQKIAFKWQTFVVGFNLSTGFIYNNKNTEHHTTYLQLILAQKSIMIFCETQSMAA